MELKIYLAGPDVFLPDALAVGRRKQDLCRQSGFAGLFPVDQDKDAAKDARSIFTANCGRMDEADIGLFNLTPFRGPSADPGTVFELGFMFAQGKPIYGYTDNSDLYRDRVAALFGPTRVQDAGSCDRHGYTIENFALSDNLMIVCAIERRGGSISLPDDLPDEFEDTVVRGFSPLAALRAFKACLNLVQAHRKLGYFEDSGGRSPTERQPWWTAHSTS